jgi:hypothetical protein
MNFSFQLSYPRKQAQTKDDSRDLIARYRVGKWLSHDALQISRGIQGIFRVGGVASLFPRDWLRVLVGRRLQRRWRGSQEQACDLITRSFGRNVGCPSDAQLLF